MMKLEKICVFCGSSDGNDVAITLAAEQLGRLLAEREITLVYGAAKIGVVHLGLTQLITTTNMHDRKLKMQEVSDGFIAMPGGLGTLEELFEILTWLQLGLHSKPIGLLNVNGFYDDLLQLFENMVRKGFVSMENYEMLLVDSEANRLLDKMVQFKAPEIPHWLNTERA